MSEKDNKVPSEVRENPLYEIIEDYKEEIDFDEELGEFTIKGERIPYNRDIWIP